MCETRLPSFLLWLTLLLFSVTKEFPWRMFGELIRDVSLCCRACWESKFKSWSEWKMALIYQMRMAETIKVGPLYANVYSAYFHSNRM